MSQNNNLITYPRDVRGYGKETPQANWPENARIALQFVINYEEGGENCVLHGDKASEYFLSEIIGAEAREGCTAACDDASGAWEACCCVVNMA